ncbi:hypothetical protein E2C01_038683 [Portunus trituberculatus]|uniref:Uncharacterized protein n=1 Tax=Portunus trituberculatus TaxID=210409 RepID=A0A5B7FBG1_PORTR|nr:hypothetical protein [Portunus trituberculatus]
MVPAFRVWISTPPAPQPVATQALVLSAQCNNVLDALAELTSEINQLKADREASSPPSQACVPTSVFPSRFSVVNNRAGLSQGPSCPVSPGSFSSFVETSSDEDIVGVPCGDLTSKS